MSDKESNARKTDPEKLVLAIKKHPEVWNTRCPEYKIKKLKDKAWDKIASQFIDNWKKMNRSEKHTALRLLIKKWNNIRDYYVKSLKARRRKRYALATQLSFLHPELQRKMHFQLSMSQSDDFKIETLEEEDEHLEEDPPEDVEEEEEIQEDYVTFVDSFDQNYEESSSSRKQETLQYDDIPEKEEDPDLMFLKSLLPDMKKLADEEKFAFKYAIMQAYMDITKRRTS